MKIKEKHFQDPDHFELTDTNVNIGNVYLEQGKLQQALQNYERALKIQEKHFQDPDHFGLANNYNSIGII